MAYQSPELPSPQGHHVAVGFRGKAPVLGDPHRFPCGIHQQVAIRKVRPPIAAVPPNLEKWMEKWMEKWKMMMIL
jgi:hypothetical protein